MRSVQHHNDSLAVPDHDLCLQIQVDLSAMLDGELDPAGVRRVTMHTDACPACRSFFEGIREQAGLHRRLAATAPFGRGQVGRRRAADDLPLRNQLAQSQRKLSRILYELGRNFVLMGLSSDFSRVVADEPMPVPDVVLRGRHLLDAIAEGGGVGADWVAARELFDGQLRTPEENLARGQRLLSECLALEASSDDARIYLGLVHYARGQRALARKQFQQVLSRSKDEVMRGFARANLGNICLDEGDCEGAITLLNQLVASGVMEQEPRLVSSLLTLALAYGLNGEFDASLRWFGRLYSEAPQRRRWAAKELSRRSHFLHLVRTHPGGRELADQLAEWFPESERDGSTVSKRGRREPRPE